MVNTVVLVRGALGLGESALAWTMGAFGAGSMLAALGLPRLLDRISDRPVMIAGAIMLTGTLGLLATIIVTAGLSWPLLIGAWLVAGIAIPQC